MTSPGYSKLDFFRNHWLFTLFLIALVFRLILLVAVVSQVEMDQIKVLVPDACAYTFAAEQIRDNFSFNNKVILTFGPGYPTFLALLDWLISPNPIVLLIIQIILSATSSVLLALLALQLTRDKRIAFMSGLINATSMASISLSAIFLSETLFFVLMVGGLLLYLRGLESPSTRSLLIAGLAFGTATLVRVMGQFFFVPLIIIAIAHQWPSKGEKRWLVIKLLRRPLITIAAMVLVTGVWAAYNLSAYGLPAVSLAQSGGLAQLNRKVISDINDVDLHEAQVLYNDEFRAYIRSEANYFEDFNDFATRKALWLLREHPWTTIWAYARAIVRMSNTSYGVILSLLPESYAHTTTVIRWIDKKGLNYLPMLLATFGVILLVIRRRYSLAVMLLSVYGYFALISGFSLTQGYRIFYPAQITGAILMTYPLLEGYEHIRRKVRRVTEK